MNIKITTSIPDKEQVRGLQNLPKGIWRLTNKDGIFVIVGALSPRMVMRDWVDCTLVSSDNIIISPSGHSWMDSIFERAPKGTSINFEE